MTTVFDIETDGLLDELTKVHVLSYSRDGKEVTHTHDYNEMREFFLTEETLVGHNIIRFDAPAIEKVLGIKIKARMIDTLALSWYLHHTRLKHGLGEYGEEYGVPKPVVDDWDNLSKEEYAHRCNEDVKINVRLWRDLELKLNKLYPNSEDKDRLVDYLSFKLDCAREQEELQWKLDLPKVQQGYDEISRLKGEKVEQLADAMPKKILTRMASQPKVMHRKDGSLSANGEKWVELCKEYKQSVTSLQFVIKTGEERGNPNSNDQVKDWLYSLGWKPRTYKFVRDKKTGDERKIEQVRKGSELCKSVIDLIDVDDTVGLLDGLTVLTHRAGILKSFLDCHEGGWLQAGVAGLTNTFRFKHYRPLVNLPAVDKPYGELIRGCLMCPEGYVLAGADMTSLEDTTKRHYMKPLDPDYVEAMSKEGFDPHLDLALHAGVITQDDIDKHNSGERSLKSLRKNYKVVNYSATYGVGAPKLARETGMKKSEAKALLEAFWSRNWAIEKVSKNVQTRELFGSMWLKNPVSGFWYSLRSDKDRFSTLNQGTGVYCFDTWVALCRKNGIRSIGQFHDEIIALVKKGDEEQVEQIMHNAAVKLNDKVKLNVPLGTDVQFGGTYADIH
ncbi:MAG: DNA polymerase [Flavobacteriaceae bacterium]|nr:DNA polymerase [Flavobacteriaceae bacterium]